MTNALRTRPATLNHTVRQVRNRRRILVDVHDLACSCGWNLKGVDWMLAEVAATAHAKGHLAA